MAALSIGMRMILLILRWRIQIAGAPAEGGPDVPSPSPGRGPRTKAAG